MPVVDDQNALQGVYTLLRLVADAGATIVADTVKYRDDEYNVGERELARWLLMNAYEEQDSGSGVWT